MLLSYRSRNGSRVLIDTAGFSKMELTGSSQLHCTPFVTGNVLALTPDEAKTLKEVTDIGDFIKTAKAKQEAALTS